MAKREYDTSRATCRVCGKPYKEGDAVYSLADKFDESIEDRDVLITFEHWDCHVPFEKALSNLKGAIERVEDKLGEIARKTRY